MMKDGMTRWIGQAVNVRGEPSWVVEEVQRSRKLEEHISVCKFQRIGLMEGWDKLFASYRSFLVE